ncbi:MAG: sugar transferase [Deltaproteobacteria bacterium]|nr:sugar transferase [Deltaproteobacteria bacterium]
MARQFYAKRGKRLLDITVAATGLSLLSPLILSTSVAVALKLGRPVFFRQLRPGKGEKLFRMLKFRTMTEELDADGVLMSDEVRLTSFGKWLRSSSLDELPALLNVLKGDMSIVGPRPLLERYISRYNDEQKRRHEVAPGITGWAQINGRNQLSWPEKFALDVWYIDHIGFLLDLEIIIRTAQKVVAKSDISADGYATMPEFMGN